MGDITLNSITGVIQMKSPFDMSQENTFDAILHVMSNYTIIVAKLTPLLLTNIMLCKLFGGMGTPYS